MSNPLIGIALDLISKRPDIANNPRSKEMIEVIKSGDNKRGEELARNLCASYGDTPENATNKAREFFHL